VERLCSHAAILHQGRVLTSGPIGELLAGRALEDVFVELTSVR
jgi:ABC-type multidrug transport system ATPase subunit